jgi:hypothetical protein
VTYFPGDKLVYQVFVDYASTFMNADFRHPSIAGHQFLGTVNAVALDKAMNPVVGGGILIGSSMTGNFDG